MCSLGGVFWRWGAPKLVEQGASYSEGHKRYLHSSAVRLPRISKIFIYVYGCMNFGCLHPLDVRLQPQGLP